MTDQQRDELRALQDRYIAWAERLGTTDGEQVIQNYPIGELITLGDLRSAIYPRYRDYFLEVVNYAGR